MSDRLVFGEATQQLAAIGGQFTALIEGQPEGWKRDYLELRKRLHLLVTALTDSGRRLLAERQEPALTQRFEDLLGRYRHQSALHQASWPVISMDKDDPAYQQSLREVAIAYDELARVLAEI